MFGRKFEITIDGVNMVKNERRTILSGNVRELSFLVSICLSGTSELRKTQSVFSIPLDFEIAKVACTCILFVEQRHVLCQCSLGPLVVRLI